MPSTSSSQPVTRYPPKAPDTILAEAEKQWLFTEAELGQTPSILDGMTPETERETRTKGLNFIMQVGIMLKLPQLTLSTAGIYFNRFLMRHSLVSKPDQPKALHHYVCVLSVLHPGVPRTNSNLQQVAAVALFLASKTEENCRKLKELIVACCRVAQKNPSLIVDDSAKDFWRWRDTLLLNEDVLLEALCFDLTVESPHKLLFDLLKRLEAEHNKKLRNAAWAFVNDSCLTMLSLLSSCRTIAAAAIYCAAKSCGDDMRFADDDRGRPWWVWASGGSVGSVKLSDIKRACNYMAFIYGNKSNGANESGGELSIYVGLATPESTLGEDAAEEGELDERIHREEDEEDIRRNLNAKTRLRLQVQQKPAISPGPWLDGATPKDGTADESESGTNTRAASAAKRSLPIMDDHDGEKNGDSDRAQKRARSGAGLTANGSENHATKPSLVDDGGSEEGELEE